MRRELELTYNEDIYIHPVRVRTYADVLTEVTKKGTTVSELTDEQKIFRHRGVVITMLYWVEESDSFIEHTIRFHKGNTTYTSSDEFELTYEEEVLYRYNTIWRD